jgi:hypothetical protein
LDGLAGAMASDASPSISRTVLFQLASGAGSGAITKTATAPLERVKILMQLQVSGRLSTPGPGFEDPVQGMATGSARKYTGTWQAVIKVATDEGVLALWKGNGANVARVVPVYALKFAFNDYFKELASVLRRGGQAGASGSLSFAERVLAGTLAGLFQILCTYPLETIRTRLSSGSELGVAYRGMVDCARRTVQTEGARGLYKGLGMTILSGSPYVGLQMSSYDWLKRAASEVEELRSAGSGASEGRVTMPVQLACGALAGLFAQTITYPGDTIRRRMQLNGANGAARTYRNSWHCLMRTIEVEGTRGLFAGLTTNAVRCIPGTAIQFAAYEAIASLLNAQCRV